MLFAEDVTTVPATAETVAPGAAMLAPVPPPINNPGTIPADEPTLIVVLPAVPVHVVTICDSAVVNSAASLAVAVAAAVGVIE